MVEFSNQWFRDTCKENELDPDNELSKVPVGLARECAVAMKKYMDAQKNYSEQVQSKLQLEIDKLNNQRIGYMLDALTFAEIVSGNGKGFNNFLKKQARRG